MLRFPSITVVFLLCVTFSYATKTVDFETICKTAKDPSFCSTFLKSRPIGVGGDLVSLAQYSIENVHTNVTNTVDLITKLVAQSRDMNEKSHYGNCLQHFNSIVEYVKEAQGFLKIGDYGDVHMNANFIIVNVDDCLFGDSPSDPPFHDTSLLPKYADVVQKIAEIIFIISNLLKL